MLGVVLCLAAGSGLIPSAASGSEGPTAAVYLFGDPDALVQPYVAADGSLVGGSLVETPINGFAFLIDVDSMGFAPGNVPGPADTIRLGPTAVEELAAKPGGRVRGISGDGDRVLYFDSGMALMRLAGVSLPFPAPPAGATGAAPVDLSEDGQVAVGMLTDGGGIPRAFRVDLDTGVYEVLMPQLEAAPGIFIPVAPTVQAVSADGSTLVGFGPGFGATEAYSFDGSVATILDAETTAFGIRGAADAASGDGRIVLGERFLPSQTIRARWIDGVLEPSSLFGPMAISADGTRMAGTLGGGAYWTEETGPIDLASALSWYYGFDLGDYPLRDVLAMSDDGRVLVGRSGGGEHPFEAFVAVLDPPIQVALPEPGGPVVLALGAVLIGVFRARRESRRVGRVGAAGGA